MPEKAKYTVNSEHIKQCLELMPGFINETDVKNVNVSFTTNEIDNVIYFRFQHITFEY